MESLLTNLKNNFKNETIGESIKQFEIIAGEFLSYVNSMFEFSKQENIRIYLSNLHVLMIKISEYYKITPKKVYVIVSNYSITEWGNLYWKMFHYTSILVQTMINNNALDSKEYSSMIFLVFEILPCNICRAHYKSAIYNRGDAFKIINSAIQDCAYGYTVMGAYKFHNAINKNLNKPMMTPFGFRDIYKCFPTTTSDETVISNLSRSPIVWVPDLLELYIYGLVTVYAVSYSTALNKALEYVGEPYSEVRYDTNNSKILYSEAQSEVFKNIDLFFKTQKVPKLPGIVYRLSDVEINNQLKTLQPMISRYYGSNV